VAEPIALMPEPAPGPAVLSSTISVRDLSVSADIGVYAHEIGQPQTLLINVALLMRTAPADRLADTVDYTRIVEVADALAHERIELIETFAYRLATACLAFAGVMQADVQVEKPGALVRGIAGTRIVLAHSAA